MATHEASLQTPTNEDIYPCDATVISSVLDDAGREVVLSRYGDDQWELWPYFQQSNVSPSAKKIDWRSISPWMAGVNYLGRSATTILAGGGGEVLLSS